MTTCIFLGPSLSLEDARVILPAIYLPPVRRGDVLAAVRRHDPEAIAIVDGYFEQVPAVWHKELLWTLDRGIALYGAASMGALRAAELAQFGMVGIGRIHEAYATGRFPPFDDPFGDDAEVAVVHGPAEAGYPATEALVDIRATLAAASEAGTIDAAEMRELMTAARSVFYKHRTWRTVLDAASLPEDRLAALRDWLPRNRVRQKRLDALALLRHLADRQDAPPAPPFRFERTLLWEQALAEDGEEG